ncbi:hypothetical protein Lalb_Chr03g0040471 [Lupinus albus]|uniref:Uncharacterized protein n=1 Tax=Lupinus albus TaxID=3870 RepID=A0A6A4QUX3_LUPAL|nr:hypothetical protein Lalb_Chr03g0040471 [Lupinus albus]
MEKTMDNSTGYQTAWTCKVRAAGHGRGSHSGGLRPQSRRRCGFGSVRVQNPSVHPSLSPKF